MMKTTVVLCAAALLGSAPPAVLAADKPGTAAAAEKKQARPAPAAARAETRDWVKMDTNKDNLISPEEMLAYLKDNPGPLRTAAAK